MEREKKNAFVSGVTTTSFRGIRYRAEKGGINEIDPRGRKLKSRENESELETTKIGRLET